MIDNIELIQPLLDFKTYGDFYMIYVMKRKKDQPEHEKENHQSVRTIKSYCVDSLEYLDKRYSEIKMLCEVFKARAYIHVQKQNHNNVSLDMMVQLANRIKNGVQNQKNLFDSVVGKLAVQEKKWIVDIDSKDENNLLEIMNYINEYCRPIGVKILKVIPTKSGYHLITEKFDVLEFRKKYPNEDIQRKNPTLLYYPDSLN